MIEKVGENEYNYTFDDDKNMKAIMGVLTNTSHKFADVNNLMYEYTLVERLVVVEVIKQLDHFNKIKVNVKGKYEMEIFILNSKEAGGILHSAIID